MMRIRSQIKLTHTHTCERLDSTISDGHVPAKTVSTIFHLHLPHNGTKTESEAPGMNLEAQQGPSSQRTNWTALPEFKLEPPPKKNRQNKWTQCIDAGVVLNSLVFFFAVSKWLFVHCWHNMVQTWNDCRENQATKHRLQSLEVAVAFSSGNCPNAIARLESLLAQPHGFCFLWAHHLGKQRLPGQTVATPTRWYHPLVVWNSRAPELRSPFNREITNHQPKIPNFLLTSRHKCCCSRDGRTFSDEKWMQMERSPLHFWCFDSPSPWCQATPFSLFLQSRALPAFWASWATPTWPKQKENE